MSPYIATDTSTILPPLADEDFKGDVSGPFNLRQPLFLKKARSWPSLKRSLIWVVWVPFFLHFSSMLALAEIIDRLVAVVNRQVITLGDLEQEKKFQDLEALAQETASNGALGGKVNPGRSAQEKMTQQAMIQRLIDQSLIKQQTQEFPGLDVSPEEIESQIVVMRDKLGDAKNWLQMLKNLKVSLVELEQHVRWQLQVMKLIDYRFRQFVIVDQKEIEDYYRNQFLPTLAKRGIREEPPLYEVEEKIREILTEEKLNVQVDEWLSSLRKDASIEIFN